ncbi:10590_t:CDS:1 [Scutellospora calospora]|uniref:10590_t:CDS:1 n=1 Tax=Scutellospora calospora TaxID=85575 RepID=A0ACA9L5R4_9GLOM|nr:10590_t:CDS:1 [Scutellospora calospora]
MTNTQNELNYITSDIPEAELEQIMENYSNSIEYDDDMFNNNTEEFDADYISDDDNLDKMIQFDCENLEVEEMIDLNIFAEEQIDETNHDNIIESEDKTGYDINEVVDAAMNNIK